jgi:hypothetical protein
MQFGARLFGKVAVAMLGSASLVLAGGVAGASAASHPAVRHAPQVGRMLRAPGASTRTVRGTTKLDSSNWSGYAQSTSKNGTFTAAKDFWTVPTVNTSKSGDQYSSDWIGIGGFNDGTLVQDGTEADNLNGTAHYDAWTEIIPASEVVITGLTIKPGDKMEGLVEETKAGTWKMTVSDLTTGKSGSRTVQYTSPGLSVEAIHERPEVGGGLATLATTNNVTLDPGSLSTAAPGTQTWKPLLKVVSGATLNEIFMVNNAGTATIATPSGPDSDSDGFTVAHGSKAPAPPKT